MKKFEFSLEKLSSYKEQVLKKEKNSLADLRKQMNDLQNEKQGYIATIEKKNSEFSSKKGFTPSEMATHRHFTALLSDKIKLVNARISKCSENIEKQLQVVIQATKDCNSLDKLKEKQLDEYKKAEQKENELFIDEFVSHKTAVKSVS